MDLGPHGLERSQSLKLVVYQLAKYSDVNFVLVVCQLLNYLEVKFVSLLFLH
jgi:hypothetical protein